MRRTFSALCYYGAVYQIAHIVLDIFPAVEAVNEQPVTGTALFVAVLVAFRTGLFGGQDPGLDTALTLQIALLQVEVILHGCLSTLFFRCVCLAARRGS